jgi:hypothetical protein
MPAGRSRERLPRKWVGSPGRVVNNEDGRVPAWHRDHACRCGRGGQHGAAIVYLSSHRRRDDIRADTSVIRRYGFPPGPVHERHEGEDYGPFVARLGLDVQVEDGIVSPRTHLLRERRRLDRDHICQVSLQCSRGVGPQSRTVMIGDMSKQEPTTFASEGRFPVAGSPTM